MTVTLDRRLQLILLLALGAALAWLGWRWTSRYDFVNLPPTASGPWVALGDSLTEGYGAAAGQDYPTVLGVRLGIRIINQGRTGDTSADGLARLKEVLDLHPRVVLLCLGGNDVLQKLSLNQLRASLESIIDQLHARGTFVVLIGVRSATLRDQNRAFFRKLAREKGVFHVPNILEGVFPKPVYMSDALHPNEAGYRLIAERLAAELEPLLPQLGGGS